MNIHDLAIEPRDLDEKELGEFHGGSPIAFVGRAVALIASAITIGDKLGGDSLPEVAKKSQEAGEWLILNGHW